MTAADDFDSLAAGLGKSFHQAVEFPLVFESRPSRVRKHCDAPGAVNQINGLRHRAPRSGDKGRLAFSQILVESLLLIFDGTSILDFIRYAVAFLITKQQFYEWRM